MGLIVGIMRLHAMRGVVAPRPLVHTLTLLAVGLFEERGC